MTGSRDGRKMTAIRFVVIVAAFAALAAACSGDDGDSSLEPGPTPTSTGPGSVNTGTKTQGSEGELSVSLSQGEASETIQAVVAVVEGQPLDAQAITDVVDRLPEWLVDEADRFEFRLPVESLARPRTGDTLDVAFPALDDPSPPEVDSGPLEVLRMQPEGDIGLAPFMSLTFNHPMVPLGTVEQVGALDVPVTISPELPGRWQWIGTRTLRFEHDPEVFDRLPMATSYEVEVLAGTTSVSGTALAETVRWTFETPAASVQWLSPQHDSVELEPVFIATFDQRVDPEAVLEVTTLTAGGDERELRLATADEIEADEITRPRAESAVAGTWVAFRAVEPFAPDQQLRIEIGPNIPSVEGPNTTGDIGRFDARTFAPLRVERQSCQGSERCEPGRGLSVSFNNPLDPESLDLSTLTIEPAIPGVSVTVQWNDVYIQGETAGDTTYHVTVPGTLADVYEQTLGQDTTLDFKVGPATPLIQEAERQFLTLDPLAEGQTFPVVVRNHDELRVRIYSVGPEDWQTFQDHLERRYDSDGPVPPPDFPLLSDEVISTDTTANIRSEVRIDLGAVLNGGHGHVVVRIDGTGRFANLGPRDEDFWQNAPQEVWVQDTSIGLDMIYDGTTGVAWTTDLRTGEPLSGVEVEATDQTATQSVAATTDTDGLAEIPLGSLAIRALVARLGDDSAINTTWIQRNESADQTIWYVVDDRGMYRPGETVRVKGWVRELDLSDGVLEYLGSAETITYVARDSFGNELDRGGLSPDASGGFDLELDLPLGANLGYGWVEFQRLADRNGGFHSHSFQIQEFRRPEFEVTTRAESPGPYYVDEPATVAVSAEYFSGGPLPDAPVQWRVTTQSASYSPPNWGEFTFGVWTPWWIFGDIGGFRGGEASFDRGFSEEFGFGPQNESSVEEFSGVTDFGGNHYLRMDFAGDGDGLPTSVTAEASVTDVNRQVWTDRTDVLVHPASLYVGLRATRTFVRAGDPLDVEAIVTNVDGDAVANRGFTMLAERLVNQYVDGEWTDVAVETETCDSASADEAVSCTFAMANGGRYRISAEVVDDTGRSSRSEMIRWVTGGDAVASRALDLQAVTLVPDRPTYAVGDTAEILVESPFGPATGLLSYGVGGIDATEVFAIDSGSTVVRIPINESSVPGIRVQVELVGTALRAADDGTTLPEVPPRPAYASGSLDLRVPPVTRTLEVTATPSEDTLAPGSSTSVNVAVRDASGAPVEGAQMLVVVVDEAILALSGYELLDPLDVFYRSHPGYIGTERGRDSILLEDPQELIDLIQAKAGEATATTAAAFYNGDDGFATDSADLAESAGGRAAADSDQSGSTVDVRQNFDALAVFAPTVATSADGTADVAFDLPDNLTRYRVMVVAVAGSDQFGSGESTITAQLPLQIRPSAPRFLNFGDDLELPIVVQNLTDVAAEVDVVIETSNLEVVGSAGRRITVPANNRIEVRFPIRTESAGTARFRAVVVGASDADAAVVSLPVYTPATTEAFATYGVIDQGAVIQPLLAPEGVYPQFGGLEIDTSSTALQALTDAVIYLNNYEYRSADGYASRILAIAALRDVLDAFDSDGLPDKAALESSVRSDITALSALQNYDGGFGSWRRDQMSSPFRSVQAMHALVEAKANGFAVRPEVMQMGLGYLRDIESHIPQDWDQATKDMLVAYSLHVRRLDGDIDSSRARTLWNRSGSDLGLDALAWIWPVVSDADIESDIARAFSNRVTETPQAATFVTSYGEDDYLVLNSDRRTDGIVLDALLTMDPESDLIPKVVAGLIGNQVKGRWNNVQENAFILLALNNYFDTFESVDPDFVARVWLGDLFAAQHEFVGRSTDRARTLVPMSELVARGGDDLIVSKDGEGRLYYRLGLRYAPDDLDLDPLDRGFVVQRAYEGVDDPSDVWLGSDGVWHVNAGATVRVRVTMVNDSRRTNMALIDPLPAGLEPLNPALAVTGDIAIDEFAASGDTIAWWNRTWYDHQNLRDDRAEAFSSYLWAGTHEYSYVARATTPGTFIVPPSRAEEIYAPEVFGRSGSDVVVIEEGSGPN